MSPFRQSVVRYLDNLPCLQVLLVFEKQIVTGEEGRLQHHVLGVKGFAKARHDWSFDRTEHQAVDGDVVFGQQNRSGCLRPHGCRCFGRAVLWKAVARIDAQHASCDDDLAAFTSWVVAHVVCCQRRTVHPSFHHDVCTAGIWFWRQVVDGRIAAVEVEYGATIRKARVRDQNVQATPFVPCGLEEVGLRRV